MLKLYAPAYGQHSALHLERVQNAFADRLSDKLELEMETCYRVVLSPNAQAAEEFWSVNKSALIWTFVNCPFENGIELAPTLKETSDDMILEVGPRPTTTTPFSTNACAVLRAAGVEGVQRVEKSRRYRIRCLNLTNNLDWLLDICGDRMTEYIYDNQTDSLFVPKDIPIALKSGKFKVIDVLSKKEGEGNLRAANTSLALGFDESDIQFYLELFRDRLKHNPTDVELFDLAQSNSEHSRHWFFKGRLVVDGVERDESLFASIQATQRHSNPNNLIAFSDNSFQMQILIASQPDTSSELIQQKATRHILYTAETHNFPTGVCPFPGAATGAGGRIRDVHATGRGAHEIAGVAGYSVGNLNLLGYEQPWEPSYWTYPTVAFASPAKILLEASDGASDYGNKFGEPLICGFTRTFGMRLSTSADTMERVEYIKPIMFSGGIGAIDDMQLRKARCERGQIVAKIGGPIYRIGVGGGTASSCAVQGARDNTIDFGAVQRGDPEMEQKLHRVIRGCVECGEANPILSIHDQGAGGNGNVLKEIVEGEGGGAQISADAFELGDSSITVGELWGAEYQESDAILVAPDRWPMLERIARRERCTVSAVGKISGDERVILSDFGATPGDSDRTPAVDFDLRHIAERDPKVFELEVRPSPVFSPLSLSVELSVADALNRVLRLPAVASKRFLTTKVDRSVTGLVAQQQCVGILQTPLSDVSVTALSYWNTTGGALACGEQPIKGLVDAAVGARMSLAEALTNLVFAPITTLKDVKCSGNWMWAARLPGEGARLVQACDAMCETMSQLGVAVDGGKDSLSMAAQVAGAENGTFDIVKAPGTLVISAYAPCIDVTRVVIPNFKPYNGRSNVILHLQMARNVSYADMPERMAGSALAQCYGQIGGSIAADLDDTAHFIRAFELVQSWIKAGRVLAGHDVSDGGLIGALLECAFAGNCGFECEFDELSNGHTDRLSVLKMLFAEELALVLEVDQHNVVGLFEEAATFGVHSLRKIGRTISLYGSEATAKVSVNSVLYLEASVTELREIWEETSDQMELLRLPAKCVGKQAEWRRNCALGRSNYHIPFTYGSEIVKRSLRAPLKVAILREEGSNGDREMAAAFAMAGFTVFDVTMSDLASHDSSSDPLVQFAGIAFVGGFSYADVLGSARGWAASIHFNAKLRRHFDAFRRRFNSFSLGVCNGCQLMALLGFLNPIPTSGQNYSTETETPAVFLDENESGQFYSGFNTVRVEDQNVSVLLCGMDSAQLGVWCSHGEGRFTYRSADVLTQLSNSNSVCLRYCDEKGQPTTEYPQNPNGSAGGVAALCSPCGRHLAMMPHPDRSFLLWQCPQQLDDIKPSNTNGQPPYSPWIRLYQNAYDWCASQQSQE